MFIFSSIFWHGIGNFTKNPDKKTKRATHFINFMNFSTSEWLIWWFITRWVIIQQTNGSIYRAAIDFEKSKKMKAPCIYMKNLLIKTKVRLNCMESHVTAKYTIISVCWYAWIHELKTVGVHFPYFNFRIGKWDTWRKLNMRNECWKNVS